MNLNRNILWVLFGIFLIVFTLPSFQKNSIGNSADSTADFHSIVDEYWNHKKAANPSRLA